MTEIINIVSNKAIGIYSIINDRCPVVRKTIIYVLSAIMCLSLSSCDEVMERVLCDTKVNSKLVSPDKKYTAIVFEYGCGVGSEPNTRISIILNKEKFVRDNHVELFFMIGSEHIKTYWRETNVFVINLPQKANVIKRDQPDKDIFIEYR